MNVSGRLFIGILLTALVSSPARGADASQATPPQTVTFSKHIAPLLFQHCAACHNVNGSAPFSLVSYRDARPRAREIIRAVTTRAMPPWKPEPGFGEFVGSRRLSDDDISMFVRWLEGGGLEGDPREMPATPETTDGWQLGRPDLVLRLDRPYRVAQNGADRIRNFVIPVPLMAHRYVRAWEFRTTAPQVVHHATMVLDPTRASRELDEQDTEPGYEGLIPLAAQHPEGHFMGWTPGQTASVTPPSMAWRLDSGTDLVAMLHLRPDSQPNDVDISLGLYFSESPPTVTPAMIRLNRQDIDIAPGDARYVITDSYTLPVDVYAYSVQPHAHGLAREVKSSATLPDGSRQPLLFIRQWDFHWQEVYRYREPIRLPAGSRVDMEITYDNSGASRAGANVPPRRVLYGQRTTDEMGDVWLQVAPARARELQALKVSLQRKLLPQNIDGYKMMLLGDPSNVGLHDDLAVLYLQAANAHAALAEFAESLRLTPQSARARYNVANCLLILGRATEAEVHFRQALTLRSDYGLAHQGLGLALQAQGRLEDAATELSLAIESLPTAETHYNFAVIRHRQHRWRDALLEYGETLRLEPEHGNGHFGRGLVLLALGRDGDAVASFRRALSIRPGWPVVQIQLAWTFATSSDQATRNPAEALGLIKQLPTEGSSSKAQVLDVTAAAHASLGLFAEAIEAAQGAIAALTPEEQTTLGREIEGRLNEYRNGRPYYRSPLIEQP